MRIPGSLDDQFVRGIERYVFDLLDHSYFWEAVNMFSKLCKIFEDVSDAKLLSRFLLETIYRRIMMELGVSDTISTHLSIDELTSDKVLCAVAACTSYMRTYLTPREHELFSSSHTMIVQEWLKEVELMLPQVFEVLMDRTPRGGIVQFWAKCKLFLLIEPLDLPFHRDPTHTTFLRPEGFAYVDYAIAAVELFPRHLTKFVFWPQPVEHQVNKSPSFVQFKQLISWLSEENIQDGFHFRNIKWLLEGAFYGHFSKYGLPPNDQEILQRCPLVFCILLELGRGYMISRFLGQGVTDEELPIDATDLEERMRNALPGEQISQIVNEIDLKQWAYTPYTFHYDCAAVKIPTKIILPIYKCQRIENESAAIETHRLCIPEDFLSPQMQQHIAASPSVQYPIGKV